MPAFFIPFAEILAAIVGLIASITGIIMFIPFAKNTLIPWLRKGVAWLRELLDRQTTIGKALFAALVGFAVPTLAIVACIAVAVRNPTLARSYLPAPTPTSAPLIEVFQTNARYDFENPSRKDGYPIGQTKFLPGIAKDDTFISLKTLRFIPQTESEGRSILEFDIHNKDQAASSRLAFHDLSKIFLRDSHSLTFSAAEISVLESEIDPEGYITLQPGGRATIEVFLPLIFDDTTYLRLHFNSDGDILQTNCIQLSPSLEVQLREPKDCRPPGNEASQ